MYPKCNGNGKIKAGFFCRRNSSTDFQRKLNHSLKEAKLPFSYIK